MQEIKHGSFVANTDQGHQARKSLWNYRQSVAAEEHIIYAIRAKLCSCATGQVEWCALANTLSCYVSSSPLSQGLILSVHLRRGCHVCASSHHQHVQLEEREREAVVFFLLCNCAKCILGCVFPVFFVILVGVLIHTFWWGICMAGACC